MPLIETAEEQIRKNEGKEILNQMMFDIFYKLMNTYTYAHKHSHIKVNDLFCSLVDIKCLKMFQANSRCLINIL